MSTRVFECFQRWYWRAEITGGGGEKKNVFFDYDDRLSYKTRIRSNKRKKLLTPVRKKGYIDRDVFFFLFCHLRIHKKHYRIYTVINRINGPNENGKNTRNTKRRRQWLLSQTELSTPTDRHRFDFAAKCNLALVLSQFLRLNSNKLNHFIA